MQAKAVLYAEHGELMVCLLSKPLPSSCGSPGFWDHPSERPGPELGDIPWAKLGDLRIPEFSSWKSSLPLPYMP